MADFLTPTSLRPRTADEFCQTIHDHHITSPDPGDPTIPINPDYYIVVDVRIYKQSASLQHESIVFHLQAVPFIPESEPEDFYVLADRNVDAASLFKYFFPRSQWHKLAADTMHPIQAVAGPSQDLGYGKLIWMRTMPRPGASGSTFKFNLAQLGTLLSTVSHTDEQYNVMRKNCYWFTRLVREVIEQIVNNAQSAQPDLEIPLPIDYGRSCWRAGHFLGMIQLDSHSQDLVGNTYTRYRNEYREFLNKRARIRFVLQPEPPSQDEAVEQVTTTAVEA